MKLIHGMTQLQFDELIAGKFIKKVKNARERNIEFSLTIGQFRQLFARKLKCAYTGADMIIKFPVGVAASSVLPKNYATLERVDSSKGYIPGNVVLVTNEANNIKAVFENKDQTFDVATAIKMFSSIDRLQKKQKS